MALANLVNFPVKLGTEPTFTAAVLKLEPSKLHSFEPPSRGCWLTSHLHKKCTQLTPVLYGGCYLCTGVKTYRQKQVPVLCSWYCDLVL
jgi:hypothetical protein